MYTVRQPSPLIFGELREWLGDQAVGKYHQGLRVQAGVVQQAGHHFLQYFLDLPGNGVAVCRIQHLRQKERGRENYYNYFIAKLAFRQLKNLIFSYPLTVLFIKMQLFA